MVRVCLEVLSSFITANHIIADHDLVNSFGHASLRVPNDPTAFLFTGPMGAPLMHDVEDIAIFAVEDGSPVAGNTASAASPYSERFIHSEIYKMYPGVQSVVHSHSEPLVAQGTTDLELRALWHMAGFVGKQVPVFDPRPLYRPGDEQNLLVNTPRLGEALAELLSLNGTNHGRNHTAEGLPEHIVILQRGHGFDTWGTSLEEMVYRGIYTQRSARIQQQAELIGNRGKYLLPKEIEDTTELDNATADRPWPLWSAEVEVNPLYRNDVLKKGSYAPGGRYIEQRGKCTVYEYERQCVNGRSGDCSGDRSGGRSGDRSSEGSGNRAGGRSGEGSGDYAGGNSGHVHGQ